MKEHKNTRIANYNLNRCENFSNFVQIMSVGLQYQTKAKIMLKKFAA